jgi:hypothetical protein
VENKMKTCHWCKFQEYDSGDWEVGIQPYEYCNNDQYSYLQENEDNPAEDRPGYDPIQAHCFNCRKELGDRANVLIVADIIYETVPVCSMKCKDLIEEKSNKTWKSMLKDYGYMQ